MRWTAEQTNLLIDEISNYSCLYNKQDSQYTNKDFQNRAWQFVGWKFPGLKTVVIISRYRYLLRQTELMKLGTVTKMEYYPKMRKLLDSASSSTSRNQPSTSQVFQATSRACRTDNNPPSTSQNIRQSTSLESVSAKRTSSEALEDDSELKKWISKKLKLISDSSIRIKAETRIKSAIEEVNQVIEEYMKVDQALKNVENRPMK